MQWIVANTLSLGLGFSLIKFITRSQFTGSLGIDSPDYLTCIIVALIMGIAQWLVLKNRLSRLHYLWIVTSIIGLTICMFSTSVLRILTVFFEFNTFVSFTKAVKLLFVNGMLGSFIGGSFIGIAQFLVFKKWKGLILVNGIAWGIAWGVALAASEILGALLYIKFAIADLSMPIQLMMFGSILGFISSLFTGTYLVWLLKRDNV